MIKWQRITFALIAIFTGITLSANIIKNGDFDAKTHEGFRRSGDLKNHEFTVFTEDLTWNKCAKISIIRYTKDKKGLNCYGSGLIIGGDKKMAGFKVNPGEIYKFSIELKGTVKRAGINALYWTGECRYHKDRHKLDTSLRSVKVQKDWVRYTGRFKIPKDAERAALHVTILGSEDQRHLPDKPGDYLLIDQIEVEKTSTSATKINKKVKPEAKFIEEQKTVPLKITKKIPVLDGIIDDPAWNNTEKLKNFHFYKNNTQAKYQTVAKIIATNDAFYIAVKCLEPEIDTLKASYKGTGGGEIWRDDEIEIFFDSISKERVLNQFVVSAGGGRWMGWGSQPIRPGKRFYKEWSAKTNKTPNAWTAEIKIPYSLIGWKNQPKNGTTLGFNICRQRSAGKNKELSAWNAVRGNFHEKSRFGLLLFGSLQALLKSQVDQIRSKLEQIKKAPEEKAILKTKLEKFSKLAEHPVTREKWSEIRKGVILLNEDVFFLRLSNLTFSVTSMEPSNADFEIPLIPENIAINDIPLKFAAAVNEFKSHSVFITNLTNRSQDYRVLLCSGVNAGVEVPGLINEKDNLPFPEQQIKIRQGVRVKNSDAKTHRQRFDPLPLMNQAYTISIPPKDSGLVWLSFDCKGVKPGEYKGFIRVIPLDESADFKLTPGKGWAYEGNMRNIPLTLTVLPIELSRKPVIPLWLMNMAPNEKFFNDMIDHGNRIFQLSPYSFKTEFDDTGKAHGVFPQQISNIVENHMKWAKKRDVSIKFLVGFSAYNIFQKHIQKDKFKYGSEQWKTAWKSWVRSIDEFFIKRGISNENYFVEIWDEPHGKDAAKVIATCALAKEACPKAQYQITLGASKQSLTSLMKMISSVDVWCLWGSHYNTPSLKPFLNELKRQKKKVWMYFCDTNLRTSPYRYYRLHAWKGLYYGNSVLGIFNYMQGPGGYFGRASWKTTASGALVYNSFNEPITSIRYECLREGFEDIKYIRKLEETLKDAGKTGIDPNLKNQAEKFLKTAVTDVVVNHPYDTTAASNARARAAELILKLQKPRTK